MKSGPKTSPILIFIVAAIAFSLLQLALLMFGTRDVWACNSELGGWGATLAGVCLLCSAWTDFALISMLLSVRQSVGAGSPVSTLSGKAKRLVLLGLTLVSLIVYIVFLSASWRLFFELGTFIRINHVNALLASPIQTLLWTTSGDRLQIALLLVGALVVVKLLQLIFARLIRITVSVGLSLWLLGAMGTFSSLKVATSSGILDSRTSYQFSACLLNMASPSLSFFWRPLVESSSIGGGDNGPLPCQKATEAATELSQGFETKKPSIILVNIEAMRSDILDLYQANDWYPNLTEMARDGLRFPRMYSGSAESSTSNVAMLTGQFARRTVSRDTYAEPLLRPQPVYNFLSPAHYRSAYFSPSSEDWQNVAKVVETRALDLFYVANEQGEEERRQLVDGVDLAGGHSSYQLDLMLVRKFDQWLSTVPDSKEVFARFYFVSSHFPFYLPPPRFLKVFPYDLSSEVLSSLSFISYPIQHAPRMKNRYLNAFVFLDLLVSEIRASLSRYHRDDAVIIVTGDHGAQFGERGMVNHGNSLYESAIRVPLVFWSKRPLNRLLHSSSVVGHFDIAPTILHLAGENRPEDFQGVPLVSLNRGREEIANRAVFSSLQAFVDMDAIVMWPFKLIKDNVTQQFLLFNLESDPGENVDLSNNRDLLAKCLNETLAKYQTMQIRYFENREGRGPGCQAPNYDSLALLCQKYF